MRHSLWVWHTNGLHAGNNSIQKVLVYSTELSWCCSLECVAAFIAKEPVHLSTHVVLTSCILLSRRGAFNVMSCNIVRGM